MSYGSEGLSGFLGAPMKLPLHLAHSADSDQNALGARTVSIWKEGEKRRKASLRSLQPEFNVLCGRAEGLDQG